MPDNSSAVGSASAATSANSTVTSDDLDGITLAVPHDPVALPASPAPVQAAPATAAPAVPVTTMPTGPAAQVVPMPTGPPVAPVAGTPASPVAPVEATPASQVASMAPTAAPQAAPAGSTPADQLAVTYSIPQATSLLSENVSPFNKPASPYQGVEYVPITEPLPAQLQTMPAPKPAAPEAGVSSQTVLPSPTVPPISATVQPLTPTPPAVTAPPERLVVQPVPATPAPIAAAPLQLESIDSIPPLQPVGIGLTAAPAPVAAPAVPAAPAIPVGASPVMPAALSQPAFAAAPEPAAQAVQPTGPALFRPSIIFSHNTWAIWKARHSTQVLYLFALIGLILIVVGLIMYWISIGAPTHLEDLPFIKK